MNKLIYSITLVLVVLVSCTTETKFPEEIKALENLEKKLAITEAEFYNVDTTKIYGLYKAYDQNMRNIKRYNRMDSLDENRINLIMLYKRAKTLKGIKIEYRKLAKEITETKKQLSDLKSDLNNNNKITPEEVKQYLNDETIYTNALIKQLVETTNKGKLGEYMVDSVAPKIDSLVTLIKIEH